MEFGQSNKRVTEKVAVGSIYELSHLKNGK